MAHLDEGLTMGEFQKPPDALLGKNKAAEVYLKWYPEMAGRLERAYGTGGTLQAYADAMILRGMAPYLPMRTGVLRRSGNLSTRIGSGTIIYRTPYARYLYYGKVMVDPKTGKAAFYNPNYGFWSRRNVRKVKTNRDLKFSKEHNPKAGPFWAERARNDLMPVWAADLQRYIDRGMK